MVDAMIVADATVVVDVVVAVQPSRTRQEEAYQIDPSVPPLSSSEYRSRYGRPAADPGSDDRPGAPHYRPQRRFSPAASS